MNVAQPTHGGCESRHRRFRHVVSWPAGVLSPVTDRRSCAVTNDRSTTLALHRFDGEWHAVNGAEEIRPQGFVPALQPISRKARPRIVHQNVEPAEAPFRKAIRASISAWFPTSARVNARFPPARFIHIGHNHGCTLAGETERYCAALSSASCSCDYRNFAGNIHVRLRSFTATKWLVGGPHVGVAPSLRKNQCLRH